MYHDHVDPVAAGSFSLSDIVSGLRRWWWLFIPPILLALGAAVFLTSRATPMYSAEAEVVIRTEESSNLFPLAEVQTLQRSPSAEEGFLASTEYEVEAATAAGSPATVSIDVGDVNSKVKPSFISFRARADGAESAATAAQSWAETYISMRHDRDVSEISATVATLEQGLENLTLDRSETLEALTPIDRALRTASDSDQISQLTTQRLILLQSLESELGPIDAQMAVINAELADLRLVQSFLLDETVSARMNRTAEVPTSPISPSLFRNIAVALIAAFVAGAGSIVIAESVDDRTRSSIDMADRTGLQCLTTVPHRRNDDMSPHVPPGQIAESFQRLSSAIDFVDISGTPAQVLMFTSARSSESKTSTVARLGMTLARQGRRTIVIGGDLRRPTLAQRFGEQRGPGLAEVLSGLYPFERCVTTLGGLETLDILRAGTVMDERSPVDLLRTTRLDELIEGLRSTYDHVLIDCPPVLPVVDALEIARVADGIVFNVFAGRSHANQVNKALGMVHQSTNTPLLGFVMTGTRSSTEGYGDATAYYGNATRPSIDLRGTLVPGLRDLPGPRRAPKEVAAAEPSSTPQPAVSAQDQELAPAHVGRDHLAVTSTNRPGTKHSTAVDDVQFVAPVRTADTASVESNQTSKSGRVGTMKKTIAIFLGLLMLLFASPAGAQSYEGTSLEEGIYYLPGDLGPGSTISFSVTALMPNSDVIFTLLDDSQVQVNGLDVQVQGAVVLRADAAGNFSGQITLPAGIDDGNYSLSVAGTKADGSPFSSELAIQVDDSAAQAASQNGSLALTGSDSGLRAFNGVVLVLLGLGLVFVASRRRQTEEVSA